MHGLLLFLGLGMLGASSAIIVLLYIKTGTVKLPITNQRLAVPIGLEILGGIYSPLFPENTKLPITQNFAYSTSADNQPVIETALFIGFRPIAKDNPRLCSIKISGIPPALRGLPVLVTSFTINEEGLLIVSAYDNHSRTDLSVKLSSHTDIGQEYAVDRLRAEALRNMDDDELRARRIEVEQRAIAVCHHLTTLQRGPIFKFDKYTAVLNDRMNKVKGSLAKITTATHEELEAIIKLTELLLNGINDYLDKHAVEHAGSQSGKEAAKKLLRRLQKIGFYKFVDDKSSIESLKAYAEKTLELFDKATNRVIDIDTKNLTTATTANLIDALRPLFERTGLRIGTPVTSVNSKGDHIVTIDKRLFLICSSREAESDNLQKLIAQRTLGAINNLLENANQASAFLHLLLNGGKYRAVLITAEMRILISVSRLFTHQNIPEPVDAARPLFAR